MLKKLIFKAVLVTLAVAAWLGYSLWQPQGGTYSGERFVEIPKGTGTRGIAAILADRGVISSQWT